MNIKKLLHDKKLSVVLSIVFGLAVVSLLYACTGDDCKDFTGPPKNILGDVFKVNGKCVKFEEKSVECNNNKKRLKLN
tara:strand:+ start:298 stop:531 length:234 start_codon:yes stop_codon:yes gene_type:complete